jgi:hypothetical protein
VHDSKRAKLLQLLETYRAEKAQVQQQPTPPQLQGISRCAAPADLVAAVRPSKRLAVGCKRTIKLPWRRPSHAGPGHERVEALKHEGFGALEGRKDSGWFI